MIWLLARQHEPLLMVGILVGWEEKNHDWSRAWQYDTTLDIHEWWCGADALAQVYDEWVWRGIGAGLIGALSFISVGEGE